MPRGNRWKAIDNYKRKLFLKYEIKKIILNSIITNSSISLAHRYVALYNISKITRSASIVQQKNKCVRTGRVWSTVKFTNYSRFVFRTESYQGNIPAFRRASW